MTADCWGSYEFFREIQPPLIKWWNTYLYKVLKRFTLLNTRNKQLLPSQIRKTPLPKHGTGSSTHISYCFPLETQTAEEHKHLKLRRDSKMDTSFLTKGKILSFRTRQAQDKFYCSLKKDFSKSILTTRSNSVQLEGKASANIKKKKKQLLFVAPKSPLMSFHDNVLKVLSVQDPAIRVSYHS